MIQIILFESECWQSYCSVLTSINETITAANIVVVRISSRENWISVANYVERMLRLETRDLESGEHAGAPA